MRYEEPSPISKEEALRVFAAGDDLEMCRALVGLAFHEPDWRWVQNLCLDFIAHPPNPAVRTLAITCLGHLARIHRVLDLDIVLPVLDALRGDPTTVGYVKTALEDIEQFILGYDEMGK